MCVLMVDGTALHQIDFKVGGWGSNTGDFGLGSQKLQYISSSEYITVSSGGPHDCWSIFSTNEHCLSAGEVVT